MVKFSALVLAASLAACTTGGLSPEAPAAAGDATTSPSRMACAVGAEFTEEEQALIRQAFLDWSIATDGQFACAFLDGHAGSLGVISIHRGPLPSPILGQTMTWGNTWDGADITIAPITVGQGLREVVAHELGHAFRLRYDGPDPIHYEGSEASLMKASCQDAALTIQAVDVEAFRKVASAR